MSAVTVMLIVGTIAATCYPLGYRLLVDGALGGSWSQAVWGVLVVGGLISIGWALNAIGSTEAMALSDRISVYRMSELMGLISGVSSLEHLERPDYLHQVERLNTNRRQLASAPRQLLSNIASSARIIAFVVLLATVSPWLLLVPIAAAPPLIAERFAKRISRQADDDMADDRRLAAMLFGLCTDAGSAGEIRAYGLAPTLQARHQGLIDGVDRRSRREALEVFGVQAIGWTLYATALMGAIAFVVVRASEHAISLGTVLMAVSLIRRSRTQLASAAASSGAMVSTLATADRLFWLEDHAAAEAALVGTEPAPERLREGIELQHITFAYPGTERPVLDDFSVRLPAGTIVALVGENGSGKTTLIKLLLGMYRPSAGTITVDGRSLADFDPASWRDRCTAAFQDFARFHLPAVESIGVADLPTIGDEAAALAALTRAGGEDLPGQLPDGLATEIGTAFTDGHGLSGGQWQKLALGRAMRRADPLLVVLDEPTASLDAQSEHALFERYSAAAAGYSGAGTRTAGASHSGTVTVLVSHRFSTVQMADLIIFIEAGHAIEVGAHDELMRADGRYAELFTLQAAAYE
jgi:ATP-binding cassette subfamily B protein